MERNPNERPGNTSPGAGASATPGGSFGGTTPSGTTGGTSGSTGGTYGQTGGAIGSSPGTAEQAKSKIQEAKEKASEKLGQAREKAHDLRLSLADKLDQGAEKLRQKSESGAYAGATGDGSIAVEKDRVQKVSSSVAEGLHNSAEWIRNNDLDAMKTGVERQVRENPGRSLLIALGIGYVLGKALRR